MFLYEEDAGLGPSVGLEGVLIKADNGENAAALGNKLADALVAAVVEATLGKNDGHTSARPEKVKVALNEEQIAPDCAFRLPCEPSLIGL